MSRHDSAQLAHVWAQQAEASGQSGGALTFTGPTLYSYSEPIGVFVTHLGRRAVLISSRSFSVTTSGHQHMARNAVAGLGLPVFMVPSPGEAPAANLRKLAEAAADAQAKVARARNKDAATLAAADTFEAARAFAAFFGLPWKAETPEAAAAEVEAARKRQARAKAREATAQRKMDADAFEAWRRGERSYAPDSHQLDEAGGAFLRIMGDELQTSRGASVPLAHAVKAFRFVKLLRERGEGWAANGRQVRVGHFRVDRITAGGDMTAGCHFIRWPEIERAAREAGVFDAPPSDEAAEAAHAQA